MKKINNLKAFSLAEMMVVMLIMTIILAASMPILSKRAKVKAAAVANSSNTCIRTINSSLDTTLTVNIPTVFYVMEIGRAHV